jgi:hypothetical protein
LQIFQGECGSGTGLKDLEVTNPLMAFHRKKAKQKILKRLGVKLLRITRPLALERTVPSGLASGRIW